MVLSLCVLVLMLVLIFPFKVNVLLQGTLPWSRTCNRKTQQFLHPQNNGSNMSLSKCLFRCTHCQSPRWISGSPVWRRCHLLRLRLWSRIQCNPSRSHSSWWTCERQKIQNNSIVLCDKLQNWYLCTACVEVVLSITPSGVKNAFSISITFQHKALNSERIISFYFVPCFALLLPGGVLVEDHRVSHDYQQGPGSGHGHVESLYDTNKAPKD